MKIEIFGVGCPKCKKTEKIVRKAVSEIGISADIEKVEDMAEIMSRGVILTPAIFIDNVKKIEGKVPSVDDIKKILQ